MNILQPAVTIGLVLAGLAFMLVGSIGLLRLPDFFCRSHAATKVDTVGIITLLFAFAVYEGFSQTAGKLLVAILFIGLTNPAPVHALARVAMRSGLRPWSQEHSATFRDEAPEP